MNTMYRFPRPARHFLGTGVQGFDAVKHCIQEGKSTVLKGTFYRDTSMTLKTGIKQ